MTCNWCGTAEATTTCRTCRMRLCARCDFAHDCPAEARLAWSMACDDGEHDECKGSVTVNREMGGPYKATCACACHVA